MARSHAARTDAAYVNLRSRLPAIVSELQSQTKLGSKDLVDQIIDDAKSRVPVRTGGLQGAIHWEPMENGWRVVAGDRDHFYGHIVEFGSSRAPAHPFLVPAVEAQVPKLSNYYKRRYRNLSPRSSLR